MASLQQHLRKVLGCDKLFLDKPPTRAGSAQLRVGDEIVGTVDQVVHLIRIVLGEIYQEVKADKPIDPVHPDIWAETSPAPEGQPP